MIIVGLRAEKRANPTYDLLLPLAHIIATDTPAAIHKTLVHAYSLGKRGHSPRFTMEKRVNLTPFPKERLFSGGKKHQTWQCLAQSI